MFIETSLGIINSDHVRVVRRNFNDTVLICFAGDFFTFSEPKECNELMRIFISLTEAVSDEAKNDLKERG